jgi:hypothetical protein
MKNIHVLPTDKPSRLFLKEKTLLLNNQYTLQEVFPKGKCQNIYITSDEEIKEGDWFMSDFNSFPIHNIKELSEREGTLGWEQKDLKNNLKIILTTDPDLIKEGVQAIDDEFLEWFVKNPSCEFVEANEKLIIIQDKPLVQHQGNKPIVVPHRINYKIIIPQEESKQKIVGYRLKPNIDRFIVDGILKNAMPIWNDEDKSVYFIRGHVAGSLVAKMKELQVLDLWFIPIYEDEEIKSDWVKEHHLEYYYKEGIMKEEPKQETLEEAMSKDGYHESDYDKIWRDGVHFGAKWQAERMYSEEDLLSAFEAGMMFIGESYLFSVHRMRMTF